MLDNYIPFGKLASNLGFTPEMDDYSRADNLQINYAPNVVNDYRIRDQQNADRAKFNSVVERGQSAAQGSGGNTAFDKVLIWSGRVNDFVDATGKVSMVATGKAIARVTVPAGVIIGVAQVGRGYYKDGNKFGYNTQKATTGFAGGLVGAWAGFEAGAAIGFEGGFVVGAAFGGIGAIPGAVIGGIVVGFGGAFGGAYYGGQFGESLIKK